jgi:hypothetical protein
MNTPVFVQTQLAQPIHDVVGGLACNVGKHDITSRAHKHTPHHSMPLTAGSLDSTSTTSVVDSGGEVILKCSIRTVCRASYVANRATAALRAAS